MILDTLARSRRYASLHPAFGRAMDFLADTDPATLAEGRYDIDGDRVYALVMTVDGKGREAARLEVHRRYIDIQVTVDGTEIIGWSPLESCSEDEGFDPETDVGFFADAPVSWATVPAGHFAVFFPEDAHAPLATTETVTKIVVKIAVE